MKIGLTSCTKLKKDYKCKASIMYEDSKYFNAGIKYLKNINVDKIYVLSAKYGLISLDDEIEPYNIVLLNTTKKYRNAWNKKVLGQLNKKTDLKNDIFISIAHKEYTKDIKKYISHFKEPTSKLKIGNKEYFFKQFNKKVK